MKLKWVGVGAILLLGAVLVVLQEYASPASDRAAARTAQQPIVVGPGSSAADDEGAALKLNAPGVIPVVAEEPETPGEPVVEPPVAVEDERPAATGSDDGSAYDYRSLAEVLAAKPGLEADGRLADAVQEMRRDMASANQPKGGAVAGLRLAPLVSDLAERRQLISHALRHDVVRDADFELVGQMLRELNHNPLNSLHPLVGMTRYSVVSGDNLWTLCNKRFPALFDVSPEVGLVKLVNGFSNDTLRVGQELLVPTEPLHIEVRTREHGLTVWLGNAALATYRVGLGKEGRTPRTSFTVKVKQEEPPWYSNGRMIPYGDPENVLGTRWMGFKDEPGASGFGIHGTAEPDSIGKDRSMGCIRLRNEEVEELFEYVARGTSVAIL
jgi:hypothetical protein